MSVCPSTIQKPTACLIENAAAIGIAGYLKGLVVFKLLKVLFSILLLLEKVLTRFVVALFHFFLNFALL